MIVARVVIVELFTLDLCRVFQILSTLAGLSSDANGFEAVEQANANWLFVIHTVADM